MATGEEVEARRRKVAGDVADRARLKRHMKVTDLAEVTGRHRSVVSEALNGKLVSEETITAIEIALTPPLVDGVLKAVMAGDTGRIRRLSMEPDFAAYIIEEMNAGEPAPRRRHAS
jgi:hypothetical protein